MLTGPKQEGPTMCIVLFDWQPDSETPLRVAANRDEFHGRPAEPARWRGDIFCGLDLTAGGTWLGIHRNGRFAVVTNYREPITDRQPGERSRGLLPTAFLESSASFLISSATTANPRPASPACAASIAAFKANKLV